MSRTAVVLFNLGAPDRLESVRPFLFNLFNDGAIIALPQPVRWLVAQLIAGRRAATARAIYEQIGGSSPPPPHTQTPARAPPAPPGPRPPPSPPLRFLHPSIHPPPAAA